MWFFFQFGSARQKCQNKVLVSWRHSEWCQRLNNLLAECPGQDSGGGVFRRSMAAGCCNEAMEGYSPTKSCLASPGARSVTGHGGSPELHMFLTVGRQSAAVTLSNDMMRPPTPNLHRQTLFGLQQWLLLFPVLCPSGRWLHSVSGSLNGLWSHRYQNVIGLNIAVMEDWGGGIDKRKSKQNALVTLLVAMTKC